jgi:multimeric flavodoxin WrbA
MPKQPEILLICGSPRTHTSEALLKLVEQGAKEAGARTQQFLLSQKHIDPCVGCGSCSKTGTCILAERSKDGKPSDNYNELIAALDKTDAIAVVAPLFFAGPPAQLKALYDRLQPYWAKRYVLGQKPAPKRPAQLFILGGGGDSHGYEPLVTISKSALAVAGFTVEKVLNFVGFKAQSEVAPLPTEAEAANMAFGELAHLRKAAAVQKDFGQRAVAAGGAFARFVRKSLEKLELQAELQHLEAEIAELKAGPPVISEPELYPSQDYTQEDNQAEYIDVGFEALRNAAREAEKADPKQQRNAAAPEPEASAAAKVATATKKAEIIAQEEAEIDSAEQ